MYNKKTEQKGMNVGKGYVLLGVRKNDDRGAREIRDRGEYEKNTMYYICE